MTDPALIAAADQAHAEAEATLDGLITWWTQARTHCGLGKSDEVAALTHILVASSSTSYAALLATAVTRLVDGDNDIE
jgi:hypothetical protein